MRNDDPIQGRTKHVSKMLLGKASSPSSNKAYRNITVIEGNNRWNQLDVNDLAMTVIEDTLGGGSTHDAVDTLVAIYAIRRDTTRAQSREDDLDITTS